MATTSDHTIRLRADASSFQRTFVRATRSVNNFSGSLRGLGFGVGGLLGGLGLSRISAAVGEFTDQMTKYRNIAARTGIDESIVAKLDYAAKQTGISIDQMIKAFEKFQLQGPGGGFEGFAAFGEELRKMPPEHALAKAKPILGEELAGQFLQAVNQNLPQLLKQAPQFDTQMVQEMAAMDDEMTRLRAETASKLAPFMQILTRSMHGLVNLPGNLLRMFERQGSAGKMSAAYQSAIANDIELRQAVLSTARATEETVRALTREP